MADNPETAPLDDEGKALWLQRAPAPRLPRSLSRDLAFIKTQLPPAPRDGDPVTEWSWNFRDSLTLTPGDEE